MAILSAEDAVIKARILVQNAINQVNQEWEAGLWVKDLARMGERQKWECAEGGHDPIRAVEQGHMGLLYSMPLNISMWLDELKPDGMRDAMGNQDFRKWLLQQPEMEYLKNYPLFAKDWDDIRKAGQ